MHPPRGIFLWFGLLHNNNKTQKTATIAKAPARFFVVSPEIKVSENGVVLVSVIIHHASTDLADAVAASLRPDVHPSPST